MNQKGFSLVLLIAVFLFLISMLSVLFPQYLVQTQNTQRIVKRSGLQAARASFLNLLNDPRTFRATLDLAANATFYQCLTDPNFDCPVNNVESPLALASGSGGLISDPTNIALGFRYDAAVGSSFFCSTYGQVGNADCLWRYGFTWITECPPVGPCYAPRIRVLGRLTFDGQQSPMVRVSEDEFLIDKVINE